MTMTSKPDFSEVPASVINEIVRNGETCLQGTVQLAIAADQRASAMAGIFGAGAVALLATAATVKASNLDDPALAWASLVTAAALFVAALLCAWSARPIDFHVAGYEPVKLAKCDGDEIWMKRYASEDIQIRIDANRTALVRGAAIMTKGAIIAAVSPFLGIASYIAVNTLLPI
jgi:hypothetical protein